MTQFKEANIAFTAPGVLSVFPKGANPVSNIGPGRFELSATGTSLFKSARAMLILRALWKIVMEYVYVNDGPIVAFDSRLDPARREVIELGEGRGWAVIPQNIALHNDIETTYQPRVIEGEYAVPIMFDIWGVRFYSDLVRRTLTRAYIESTLPWPATVWVFPNPDPA